VTAGCADPPTREQTDADVLVELDGARTATVTLEANDIRGFLSLSPVAVPRGGPPTLPTTTTEPPPPTPEQIAQMQAAFARGFQHQHQDITTDIRAPRTTLADIGDALAPGAVVTTVRRTPNRIVGTLRFPHPLRSPSRVHPAALARALGRGGLARHATVWVGICIPSSQGRWSRTPDAFDRTLGCAGWVPDRRASTVGVLDPDSRRSPTFWPIAALITVALGLVALGVARGRAGRRRWYAPAAVALAIVGIVATVNLIRIASAANALDEDFVTHVDRSTVGGARNFTGPGVVLVIIGLGEAAWFATDRDRHLHHLRRQSAFADDQPENRSLRGSSV
jgi:hypothetical protein